MRELICIVCPRGCKLKVDENLNVTGNFCNRGIDYGKSEVTNPTRIITSTVKINSNLISRLPVKTSKPIPISKIFEVMQEINKIKVSIPVLLGDILLENILETKADIVATRSLEK